MCEFIDNNLLITITATLALWSMRPDRSSFVLLMHVQNWMYKVKNFRVQVQCYCHFFQKNNNKIIKILLNIVNLLQTFSLYGNIKLQPSDAFTWFIIHVCSQYMQQGPVTSLIFPIDSQTSLG